MCQRYSKWLLLMAASMITCSPASIADDGSQSNAVSPVEASGQNPGHRPAMVDQSFETAPATAPEHAAKVALIKELLAVSRADRNAQLGYDTVLDQEMHGFRVAVNARIDKDPKLTPDQKAEAKRLMLIHLNKRMKRAKELMQQKIDLPQVVSDCYVKLYDKYFTTQEIKDILAWYKTATAQKLLDVLPNLTKEMMQLVNAAILPKLKDLEDELSAEDSAGKFNP